MKRKKLKEDAIISGRFKCDAEGCDYREEVIIRDFKYVDEYIEYLKSSVEKKCPKCGASLFTLEQCSQVIALVLLLHNPIYIAIEKLFDFFGQKKKNIIAVTAPDKNIEFYEVQKGVL